MTILISFVGFIVIVFIVLIVTPPRGAKYWADICFLDKTHSSILKGYAILFVLVGHVGQYAGVNGIEFPAAVGVSLFLILSGYGINKSFQKSHKDFWKKRIIRIWIPYVLSNGVFNLFRCNSLNFKDIILNFTLIKPQYTFGWYLRYLIVCYIAFYIIWRCVKNEKLRWIILASVFSLWFVIRSTVLIDATPFLQARQMLAFPLGLALSSINGDIIKKIKTTHCILMIGFGTLVYGFLHIGIVDTNYLLLYNICSLFTCVICATGFVFLVYLWKILQNPSIKWVALISYELYLTHGYTIKFVHNGMQGLFVFVALTILLSICLYWVTKFINYLIKKLGEHKYV